MVFAKLAIVQDKLKAPKGQFNKFGNYNYRSCEDILEAAKPLCIENGLVLTISDDINIVGNRHYVVATAKVVDLEDSTEYSVKSFAREEETKKGMDGSQITGAASSYARKYALNGLFCIDDTKDSDVSNKHEDEPMPSKVTKSEIEKAIAIASKKGITPDNVAAYALQKYGTTLEEIKAEQYVEMFKYICSKPDKS